MPGPRIRQLVAIHAVNEFTTEICHNMMLLRPAGEARGSGGPGGGAVRAGPGADPARAGRPRHTFPASTQSRQLC